MRRGCLADAMSNIDAVGGVLLCHIHFIGGELSIIPVHMLSFDYWSVCLECMYDMCASVSLCVSVCVFELH